MLVKKIEKRLEQEIKRIIKKEELSKDDYEILRQELYRLKPLGLGFTSCCGVE